MVRGSYSRPREKKTTMTAESLGNQATPETSKSSRVDVADSLFQNGAAPRVTALFLHPRTHHF